MGRLQRKNDVFPLSSRCLIGRSKIAEVRPDSKKVSSEHAVLFWKHERWFLRDLSSRNGSFVNGVRVSPSTPAELKQGDTLRFSDAEATYGLVDASPPAASAQHAGRGNRTFANQGLLVLPGEEPYEASVFWSEGAWVAEIAGESIAVTSGDAVDLPSGRWVLDLPTTATGSDPTTTEGLPLELGELQLELAVSRDEEAVHLTLQLDQTGRDLGIRASNYLLLTLARIRLEEAAAAVKDPGWVEAGQLADLLGVTVERLNVDVHRVRRQLAQAGVLDAHRIIERRTGRLRLGTSKVLITHA